MAPLSEEEINFVRFALLLKGVSPRAVRTFFEKEFPSPYLPSRLNTNYNTLYELKSHRVLNQAQWNLLFPRNGVPDSTTFDVTLMICLLRHLTMVTQPMHGFDRMPLQEETTPGSDLARIKCYRNKLAHFDSHEMDTANFNTAWRDISDAIGRLGGQSMYQECQDLKVKILDQSNMEIMVESLAEMREMRETIDHLGEKNSEVTENLRELQDFHITLHSDHSRVTENLRELQDHHRSLQNEQSKTAEAIKILREPIPRNIKDIHKQEVEKWQTEDNNFAETTASSRLLLAISKHDTNVVTVIGPKGCGKSFLTKHIAIRFQANYRYTIIPVDGIKKVTEWYDPKSKQLFVLDIVKDLHTPSQLDHILKKWQNLSAVLQTRLKDNSFKMIACCSTDTYENPEFEKISLLNQNKFDLKADENILSDEDIEAIASRHMKEDEVVVIKEIKEDLKKLDNFPMLCRKFADEKHGNPKQYFAEYMSLAINDNRVENSNSTVDINTSTSTTLNPGQITQGMFRDTTIRDSTMIFNFNINTINKN